MAFDEGTKLGNVVKRAVAAAKKKAATESSGSKSKPTANPKTTPRRTTRPPTEGLPGAPRSETVKALNREPETAPSSPERARAINVAQAETASRLTSGPVPFRREASDTQTSNVPPQLLQLELGDSRPVRPQPVDKTDHLVDDPIQEEQRSDLEFPPEFEPGSELPETPDLSEATPESSEELANGTTVETYTEDGVTYERKTRPDGTVETHYEVDGVTYNDRSYDDGRRTVTLSEDTDEAFHSRTVEYDEEGEVHNETAFSVQASYDSETREAGTQTRSVRIDENGVTTTTERVQRPGGGESNFKRVEHPSGAAEETYTFEGDEGAVQRTTNESPDGSAETRTERSYTTDQPIEELTEVPQAPDHVEQRVAPLPQEDREPTEVREVEVTSTNTSGDTSLEYQETTYSQTSGQVEPTEQSFGQPGISNIEGDPEGSSVTQTVTTVTARDEDGDLQTSTAATQSVTLAGERDEALGGDVSITSSVTWNENGETTESFSQEGFTENDLFALTSRSSPDFEQFTAKVGDERVYAGLPHLSKSPFDHLNMKGGSPDDWLYEASGDGLNVSTSITRDAEGNVLQENINWSSVDENGNGRTVTRSESDNGVAWNYTDYDNDGKDYERQTVIEGTDISVFESHQVTGPGEFTTVTETRDGDQIIANSEASRERLTESELRDRVAQMQSNNEPGALTDQELERMIQDGGPYYLESINEHAETILDDDGQPKRDSDGNIIQPGHDTVHSTFTNDDGYSVSNHYHQDFNSGQDWTTSRTRTVTDPSSDPPIQASIQNTERDPETGQFVVTEEGDLKVMNDGRIMFGDEEVADIDFEGQTVQEMLMGPGSVRSDQLIAAIGGAAKDGETYTMSFAGVEGRVRPSATSVNLGRLAGGVEIFGLATGARDVFSGARSGNYRQVVEGLGGITGGVNTLAAATSAIAGTGRLGATASRVSSLTAASTTAGRVLGAAGGAIGFGFGVYDILNAEDGWGRAAGALNASAGAIAFGSAFFGPPGWIAGGLLAGSLSIAAVFVGNGGQHDTAGIDERLRD